jgi:hypothetical protein
MEVFGLKKPVSPMDVVMSPELATVERVPLSKNEVKSKVQATQREFEKIHIEVSRRPRRVVRDLPGSVPVDFSVGDYVLLSCSRKTGGMKHKAGLLWAGPYRVVGLVDDNDYVYDIQDLAGNEVKAVHAQHLKRYADKSLKVTQQVKEFAAYGGAGFLVENIISHEQRDGEYWLRVHWKGYPVEEADWQRLSAMNEDVPVLVKRYVRSVVDASERDALQQALLRL